MISQMIKMKKGEPLVIKPEHDTQYVLLFSHDAEDTPYSVTLVFAKEGVSAEILAIYKLAKNEKLNLTTVAQHAAPNTTCTTSIKGVLLDGGHSDYVGKILIEKKAQQTNSYLDHNVLVVGQGTHNSSQPILEIEADDVKASHGATTGRINEDQLYYLRSRGFSLQESEKLIVEGFFENLLHKIINVEVREEVRSCLK